MKKRVWVVKNKINVQYNQVGLLHSNFNKKVMYSSFPTKRLTAHPVIDLKNRPCCRNNTSTFE